jgi:hypothetical protein
MRLYSPRLSRPKTVRADARRESHGVAHQSAYAPVSIRKGMNEVEAVMSRGDRHDASRLADLREAISSFEVPHERLDPFTRWRQAPTHLHVLFLM